ncbi:F-box protein At3g07870-like isoform X2 [Punica granatum]|uniref:F-box domain-containing protein n=2 Tax=Punica granatum TaxID=22663 RepID=A0A218XNU7_PUNGR|nr:F-box protein At3g07870-like isoform X2 [Punica granatum]XP_031374784.1 F-box protein At3g07870-like isoform X2 [Punica granatum]OWM86905.1 hypothetical protein CDL15_Pgr015941 [Punica granatum]PKI37604.1 hypothetical protein CRG98_042028 [Punica granatum]
MTAELPPEILTEILARLPAKSLLRFRSVSRSWNSLIRSPPFIALHLSRSIATGDSSSSILLRHYSLNRRRELNTVFHDGPGSLVVEQELDFPIRTHDSYYYVGACNGLLCLSDYLINYLGIVLWNPSIRTCFQVPVPRFVDTDATHTDVVGFGFDCRTNQYKVLRLIYVIGRNHQREIPPEVEVFVLGTERWRRIDADVPYVVPESSSQAILHGAIHWMGYRPKVSVVLVVVFDLHEEVFREIEIPSSINYPSVNRLSVAVYGESLCLFEHDPWVNNKKQSDAFCVWVMKRYGVKESWTKQFSVDMRDRGGLKRVLGFRKHGEILVVNGSDELVSYDPESRSIEQLGLHGIVRSFEATPHMECLVLLKEQMDPAGKASSSRLMV